MQQNRRRFVIGLGSLAAATALPSRNLAALFEPPLYPPMDLSYFDKPVSAAPSAIRFGYAAITWNGKDRQAIDDITEVGFRGIQLRSNVLKEFGDKPRALRDLLARRKLTFVALSGGGPQGADYDVQEAIATQVKHATFLREAGGLYLQMTDSTRPKDRAPSAEDAKRLGRLLTEVGKRTTDLGIPMAYHNHMGSLGQSAAEVDALMHSSDPRYVKLLLDVAHYTQGGGDPAAAIRKYRERILFLHIKDVENRPSSGGSGSESYRFVELGRGRVNLRAVFDSLREIKFRGWAIVELDRVPDETRSPKECAMISKEYLEDKIGLKVLDTEP
ncbi:MAG TPA: TIM barrel protein [Blastocatellia bacterium]|nr:TIM barrel protein [Blastocatellia bacterium]